MGKLLIPISTAVMASVATTLRGLISRCRLAELISRLKLRTMSVCSKSAGLVDRLKFKDLIGRCKLPKLVSRSKFKGLISTTRLSTLVGRFKPRDLIARVKLSGLISYLNSLISSDAEIDHSTESAAQLDLSVLNCRVQLANREQEDAAFSVEICGSIHARSDKHCAALKISILDITEGVPKAAPVQTQLKRWTALDDAASPVFCYSADLGKLPRQVTTLSDWTAVAQLRLDWLDFPHKGRRNLQFDTSVLAADSGQELARARCTLTYDNPAFGYLDLEDNIRRTKILAVALAFAVSAADNKLYNCEVDLIKNWAKHNILDARCWMLDARTSPKASIENRGTRSEKRKLDTALDRTVTFFREGNKLDIHKICREIVEIAPVGRRYDILNLCLHVAQANRSVAGEELAVLKDLAGWLDVDADKFRTMMEKVLPVGLHQSQDAEAILGITSEMSKEKARQHLNREYSKWNSRVTSSDPEIQAQADQMLTLIAEARSRYMCESGK